MARPKKLSDTDAVRLVDAFYEAYGNPERLRFSLIEAYAIAHGISVNAYDLRRSPAVRERITQLKALAENSENPGAVVYKGLDIDGFIRSNKTIEALKRSLAEIDGRWQKLYDYAADISKQNIKLTENLEKTRIDVKNLKNKNTALLEHINTLSKSEDEIRTENRYLRKMLQTYLYPELADSILKELGEPNIGEPTAPLSTIFAMTDGDTPGSLTESISADMELRSREEILFDKLLTQSKGDF